MKKKDNGDGQPDLFSKSRADQIFERFVEFHQANPNVWSLFCHFADDMRKTQDHYSARAIFERVRWEIDYTVKTDNDPLKINDHCSPYYGRMYLATHPEAEGFFQLRKRTSEDRSAYKIDLAFFHTGPAVDEESLMERLKTLAEDREPAEQG